MKRTGNSKIAVVGWGRGMGHTGHMYLADAVIAQAGSMKADPYFFVSKTVGKDDPLFPEEKLSIYQTVFPQYKNIFTAEGNLNQALQELAKLGYQGVVLVVGADQKESFKYLEKPNKEGVPVYQSFGFSKLKVISRQETRSKFRGEEGPRATPMREILLNPNASDEEKYQVWRRDMPSALSDAQVADLMKKAASRLATTSKPKSAKVKDLTAKVEKIKEAILSFRTGKQQPKPQSEPLGYKHMFKQPDEVKKPEEKRFHGWQEYNKDKHPEEVAETRIIDAKALINAFYVSPEGRKHRVAERIPYYLLDKLVPLLTKKYAITMNDIEVRPADASQYRRTNQPELAEGMQCTPNEVAELLYNAKPEIFTKFGDEFVMNAIEQACEQHQGSAQEVAHTVVDILKQGIAEAYDHNAPFNAADFNRHMEQLRAREELRKTDPMKALVGDLIDKDNAARNVKKKPQDDDSMSTSDPRHPQYAYTQAGQQWVDEGEEEALAYATKAHAGQTRSGGDPYITHPMRVADHIRQYKQSHNLDALISAAYLHDTIEDTDTTQEVLHDLFGGLVASLVKELTSDPEQIKKMGKAAYLSHKMAAMSSYGLVIKLADRLDNVKDITTAKTPEWRQKYAKETNQILDYIEKTRALSGTHNKLISLIRAKLAEIDNPPQVADEGISRRGILKGIAGAGALGAAGKASAIAGAFPTPSHQAAMYKAAADSNRAQARADAAEKAKADAERLRKNTELVDKEQRVNHHKLDEFAPGNGDDDGLPHAEYEVYQCSLDDQFEWIGEPLMQTDRLDKAHGFAYNLWQKHPDKCFMVWQERSQGSRGGYGPVGSVLAPSEDDITENSDYLDEK